MAILMSKPVRAFVQQDHQSHIMVHQSFMNDPKIGMLLGQNPNAQVMFNSMQAHIAEHAAYAYRAQVQQALGVELPDPNEQMDPQTEYALAGLLAQAANVVGAQNKNEQAQAQAQQQAQDPLVQMQKQELELKGREVAVKEDAQLLDRQIAQAEGKLGQPTPQQQDPTKIAQAQATQAQTAQKLQQGGQVHSVKMAGEMAAQQRMQQKHAEELALRRASAQGQESRAERAHRMQMEQAAQRAKQQPVQKKGDK